MILSTQRLTAVAALAATLGLSACATDGAKPEVAEARTSTEQFPIEVSRQPEEIRLAVHTQGLSSNQESATAMFVDGWRDAAGGEIVIQAPNGAGDPAVVHRMVEATRYALNSYGVPREMVRVASYDGRGQAAIALVVGYERYVAQGPECGRSWSGLTRTSSNKVHENFGCAVTANMAAQIADPRDLMQPRHIDPADASRRGVVLDKYRKGEITGAVQDKQGSGVVSDAVD